MMSSYLCISIISNMLAYSFAYRSFYSYFRRYTLNFISQSNLITTDSISKSLSTSFSGNTLSNKITTSIHTKPFQYRPHLNLFQSKHENEFLKYDDNGRKFIEDTLKDMLQRMEEDALSSSSSSSSASSLLFADEEEIDEEDRSERGSNNMMNPSEINASKDGSKPGISNEEDLLNGVIRVYCTHSEPNFNMPWQRMKQESSTSSGFVIHRKRYSVNTSSIDENNSDEGISQKRNEKKSYILTNAHSVEYGSIIQVKKRQSEKKYLAKVLAVGFECDLAVLDVEDKSFWDDVKPLELGPSLPDLQEDVSVVGYPVGGDSISISSGVVSRIEMQEYAQAHAELLAIQIDAAINPGNSGGPVVNDQGQVIGIAFQSLSDEDIENIGYVVPVNVISHFLEDVERNGEYSGVCGLGVRLQAMENDNLREYYGMSEHQTGILVAQLLPLAPASNVLQRGDVILSMDGIRIANDGTIPFRDGKFSERVQFTNYLAERFPSDIVKLEILRDRKKTQVEVPVWVNQPLVPSILLQRKEKPNRIETNPTKPMNTGNIIGVNPSYLMIGGLVFTILTKEYIHSEFNVRDMGNYDNWSTEFQLLSMINKPKSVPGEEVVLLSQVIAHKCNIGYESFENFHLLKFNGESIVNIKHFKDLLDSFHQELLSLPNSDDNTNQEMIPSVDSKEESVHSLEDMKKRDLVFEFMNGRVVILNAKSAFDAQNEICGDHLIPSYASLDLI